MTSISFDRAADVYDVTNRLPDQLQQRLTAALAAELSAVDASPVLEVGAGTGRITRPLAERGLRVCSVDIAPRMLGRLRAQLGPGHIPPDLVLGDATRLPIADGSFLAVLVFHVLHLVSSWERAVQEICRVLAPNGVLVQDFKRVIGQSPWDASAAKWDELEASHNFISRSRPKREQIGAALQARDGSCRILTAFESDERHTPAEHLERIRNRTDSWTWEVPDDLFEECFAEYERWVREYYGDTQVELSERSALELEVWRFA